MATKVSSKNDNKGRNGEWEFPVPWKDHRQKRKWQTLLFINPNMSLKIKWNEKIIYEDL